MPTHMTDDLFKEKKCYCIAFKNYIIKHRQKDLL